MTRATTVQLRCDDCPTERQGKPGQTVDDLRAGLADVGWLSDGPSDADLCPTCANRRLLEARAGQSAFKR